MVHQLQKLTFLNCKGTRKVELPGGIHLGGYNTFTEWRTRRNTNYPLEQFRDVLYCNPDELDHMLCCFVMEVRRGDGKPYPPSTLYQICAAVSRFMKENGIFNNFLDGKNMAFLNFRKTLDARMKELASAGVGMVKKQAEPITNEMEEIIWEKGLLGNCSGYTSKNFNGGLNQRKITGKTIKHYSEPGQERSLFDIYKNYMDLVGDGPMYRRPLATSNGNEMRFSSQPIGVNKLGTIIKTMCNEAGFEGTFSNHSGKRTCATSLFQAGIDEQLIMQRTGHRSRAVQAYKVPSLEQLETVSKVLDPPSASKVFSDPCASVSAVKLEDNERNKENSEGSVSKKPKLENGPFINITNCTVNIQYE